MPLSLKTTRALNTILARAVATHEPGVAVGIAKGGRVVWRGGRGLANIDAKIPFAPSTPFRICSISKQFACALVMREARAGRIALDAHPSRYLTWAKVLDSTLTVAHLMQNKSGVRDQWVLAMMMGARAEQRFTLADGIAVNRLAPQSMFAPGSQNLYCNANFEMLGQILEAVTGETVAALFTKHIFVPLGMNDTYLGVDTARPLVGDARGYRFHDGAWVEEENALHWAASAGIVSTVEDLLKWAACLRDPKALGLPWVANILVTTPFSDGAAASYASGINHVVNATTGRSMFTHAGALRGWRSTLIHFVKEDVSIAVFMNRTNAKEPLAKFPSQLAKEIAAALGIDPVWHVPGEKLARGNFPASVQGARASANASANTSAHMSADMSSSMSADVSSYISREQGLMVQLRYHEGQPQIFLHLSWSPLYRIDAQTFATDDRHLSIRFMDPSCKTLMLAMNAENFYTPMQAVASKRSANVKFAATTVFAKPGHYQCAPIASKAEIVQRDGTYAICFTGIFGTGIHYPLTVLNETTAWFDLSRGVDESPPGRVLVIYHAKEKLLELSCMLARRMVFRAA